MNTTVNREYDYLFKLLIVGDAGIGKTSLLKSMVGDSFNSEYIPSKEYDFKIKSNIIINDKNFKLQIWDTFIERFREYRRPYRGAHGIFMLYDCTDRCSFNNIRQWYGEIERYACESVIVVLVATKIDIPETKTKETIVSKDEGMEVAKNLNIPFIEISSKNQINIDKCLLTMVTDIYESRYQNETPSSNSNIKLNIKKNNKDKCIIN